MSSIFEMVIVGVVVAVALVWAGRAAWRSFRKTGGCSSCSSSGECPLVKDPDAPISLTDIATDCDKIDSTEPAHR
jgi:hypothetical protein